MIGVYHFATIDLLAISTGLLADVAPPSPHLKEVPNATDQASVLTAAFESGYAPVMIIAGLILTAAVVIPAVLYFRSQKRWWLPIPICLAAYLAFDACVQPALYTIGEDQRSRITRENTAARQQWEEQIRNRPPRVTTRSFRPDPESKKSR
jgi:hypothetical protein